MRARTVVVLGGHARPGPRAPSGERHSVADEFRARLEAAAGNPAELGRALRDARDALKRIKRAPLPSVALRAETADELYERICAEGEGFEAIAVAVACRTSAAIVRKARLAAGRDAERGRALPPKIANGAPTSFGLRLIAAGYSVRQAAALAGVPKSTLSDHARRP